MPHDLTGVGLSVETDEEDGVCVWLIGEDVGRYRLVAESGANNSMGPSLRAKYNAYNSLFSAIRAQQ